MKKPKLNKALIRKMIKRIEERPEAYLQSRFFVKMGVQVAAYYDRPKPICGSAECLAGEAIICTAPSVKKGIEALKRTVTSLDNSDSLKPVAEKAARLMGLSIDLSGDGLGIFDSQPLHCWPAPFGAQYAQAKTYKGEARAAINLLKAILKTDGKILER